MEKKIVSDKSWHINLAATMKPKARQKNNALLLDFCVGQISEIKLLVLNESVQAVDRFSQGRRLTQGAAAAEIVKENLNKEKLLGNTLSFN